MRLTDKETLVLSLFVFGSEQRKVGDIPWCLRAQYDVSIPAKMADQICQTLESRGFLICTSNVPTVPSRRYALKKALPLTAMRQLIRSLRLMRLTPANRSDGLKMLCALIDDGQGFEFVNDQSFGYYTRSSRDDLWFAATRYADMLPWNAVPQMTFPQKTQHFVYRIIASVFFCHGLDVVPLLLDWRSHQTGGFAREEDFSAIEYAALCFWTGRMDLLDVFGKSVNGKIVDDFVAACLAAAKGNLDAAYRGTAFMADLVSSKSHGADTLISMPASHLFALAVTAFHKPAKTRIAKLAAKVQPAKYDFAYSLPDNARSYYEMRTFESSEFFSMAGGWASTPDPDPSREWHSPVCRAGAAIASVASGGIRERMERFAPEALQLAEKAVVVNLPTIAALYLAVFGWTFKGSDAEKAQRLVDAVKKANGIWFRPYETDAGTWRLVVEALDRCLPAAKKAAAVNDGGGAKSGRIVWALAFRDQHRHPLMDTDDKPYDFVLMCNDLTPCYRGPRGADDGTADKPVTYKALLSGKYEKIFTDTDRAVIAALQKDDCITRYASEAPFAALKELCGYDCVTERIYNPDTGEGGFIPIEIVRRDMPLAVKSTAGDGLAISVEPWCQRVIEDYAIRSESDGHRYALYAFPKATRAAMEVFTAYGKDGAITIPKAGMDAMRPLLPRMAALAPIQGELAAVGGGADLERIPGNATPLVRIEFDGGILSLSLKAKPLDGVDLLFLPGVGQPERMVAYKGHTAVVVRDLAAEKSAADKVREAMEEFESWAEGGCEWRIDSFVHALKALVTLKSLGGAVRLEWRKGKPIVLAAPKPGAWRLSATEGADFWFSVGGEFKLDDGQVMSMAQLIAAYRNRTGEFLPFGDSEYVYLSSTLLKRIEALDAAGRVNGKSLAVPAAAIPMLDGVFGGAEGAEGLSLPTSMESRADAIRESFARKVIPPARLKAELRPYQRDGYEWLSRLASCGFGACLADDMGLGKTVQVIALLLERAPDGASLVVAPASVCGNWRDEIARFAPTLRTIMAWDEKADAMDAVNAADPGDVVIAGYGLLVAREEKFAAKKWNGVVLDEAQAIKNETSKRAKAVKRLNSRFRVAATGTPVENRLSELWSISDFLNPGLLGSIGDFAKRFTIDGRATPALKRLVSPLILRRVKRDVLEDLPEKTEITLPVILGEDERAGYEACRRMALETLEAGGAENRISILAELTRLRRYCCHPSLVTGDPLSASAKMDALLELLGNLRDNGHRALVFSQFTDYLSIVQKAVEHQGWTHLYLDGQTPAAERGRLVEAFQRGDGDFFIISLKAGGMGLNLTAANYVILLDPWWNPAVENQAADRAHRIGQKNPVTVYRLIATETVEERVIELHKAKRQIAEDVLDGAASTALTPDELMKLFR